MSSPDAVGANAAARASTGASAAPSSDGGSSGGGRRSVTRRLAITLAVVSVLSVLLASVFMWWSVRGILDDSTRSQLEVLRRTRARQVVEYLQGARTQTDVLARSPQLAREAAVLFAAFEELATTSLSSKQLDELSDFYMRAVDGELASASPRPINAEALIPGSPESQYLQLHYLARSSRPSERGAINDPGDGSSYSGIHADIHEDTRRLAQRFGFDDAFFVDSATRSVVYSAEKRVDFGTSLESGPYRNSGLGLAVAKALSSTDQRPVIQDFSAYGPAGGRAISFIAAQVVADGQILGVLVVALAAEELSALLTTNGQWELTGLGETNETYLVGSDLTLRSEARAFVEDPGAYGELLVDSDSALGVIEAVQRTGSTMLVQPVMSESIRDAFRGEDSTSRSENYLGRSTLSSAALLDVDDLDWVVVADIATSEAFGPVRAFEQGTLIVGLVLAGLAAVAGTVLARAFVRPMQPVIAAAERVAAGDLDVSVADDGGDEFSDLARDFDTMVAALRDQHQAIERAAQDQEELLLAALPRHLASQVREGRADATSLLHDATVVAVRVNGLPDEYDDDLQAEQVGAVIVSVALTFEDTSERHEVERIRAAGDTYLGVAGLQRPGFEIQSAVRFIAEADRAVRALGAEHGLALTASAGVACGDVGTGVVESRSLSVDVWGEASRLAVTLEAMANPGQVLLHASAVEALADDGVTAPVDGLLDLGGARITAGELLRDDEGDLVGMTVTERASR